MKEIFFERARKKMKHYSVSHYPEMHFGNLKEQNKRFIYFELFRTDLNEGGRVA